MEDLGEIGPGTTLGLGGIIGGAGDHADPQGLILATTQSTTI